MYCSHCRGVELEEGGANQRHVQGDYQSNFSVLSYIHTRMYIMVERYQ